MKLPKWTCTHGKTHLTLSLGDDAYGKIHLALALSDDQFSLSLSKEWNEEGSSIQVRSKEGHWFLLDHPQLGWTSEPWNRSCLDRRAKGWKFIGEKEGNRIGAKEKKEKKEQICNFNRCDLSKRSFDIFFLSKN